MRIRALLYTPQAHTHNTERPLTPHVVRCDYYMTAQSSHWQAQKHKQKHQQQRTSRCVGPESVEVPGGAPTSVERRVKTVYTTHTQCRHSLYYIQHTQASLHAFLFLFLLLFHGGCFRHIHRHSSTPCCPLCLCCPVGIISFRPPGLLRLLFLVSCGLTSIPVLRLCVAGIALWACRGRRWKT